MEKELESKDDYIHKLKSTLQEISKERKILKNHNGRKNSGNFATIK